MTLTRSTAGSWILSDTAGHTLGSFSTYRAAQDAFELRYVR